MIWIFQVINCAAMVQTKLIAPALKKVLEDLVEVTRAEGVMTQIHIQVFCQTVPCMQNPLGNNSYQYYFFCSDSILTVSRPYHTLFNKTNQECPFSPPCSWVPVWTFYIINKQIYHICCCRFWLHLKSQNIWATFIPHILRQNTLSHHWFIYTGEKYCIHITKQRKNGEAGAGGCRYVDMLNPSLRFIFWSRQSG